MWLYRTGSGSWGGCKRIMSLFLRSPPSPLTKLRILDALEWALDTMLGSPHSREPSRPKLNRKREKVVHRLLCSRPPGGSSFCLDRTRAVFPFLFAAFLIRYSRTFSRASEGPKYSIGAHLISGLDFSIRGLQVRAARIFYTSSSC
jgi:hypothetical protein